VGGDDALRSTDALHGAVQAWVEHDPDPTTRAELLALLDAAATDATAAADLADRFAGTLAFGTAGLRGRMAAGPNRMNRAVVIRAAAGLAAYLRERDGAAAIVGFDARHGSAAFARDTCAVLEAAGLEAMVLPYPLPTPVLAFAIRQVGADAGVMVTASHNPPADNGYKVYLGDGSQIVPPADTEIAAAIDAAPPADEVPRADDGWVTLGSEVVEDYLDRAAGLLDRRSPRALRVAYTPLHGVGRDLLLAAFERAGFEPPIVVAAQAEPDPDFPTVAFPNPEEPGAMDAAIAVAAEAGADLALANDPDADRCAVAVPDRDGAWRMLTGDEVGALLGAHLLSRGRRGTFASSIVSSSLLGRIAATAGVPHVETLTGFKWIARVPGLAYGYEEALGYCCDPDGVRDKDGVTAALFVAELAAALRADGRTLVDALDDLARRHGVHATGQVSLRVEELAQITETMARLRTDPPARLGGLRVLEALDLRAGSPALPPTDGLRYRLEGGARVIVRPSGTEPKLKCYLEAVVPVDGRLRDARAAATERLDRLREAVTALLHGAPAPALGEAPVPGPASV
jgi:phosphomannomutase